MTPALRTARTLTAAATALGTGAVYLAVTVAWWAVLPGLYVAVFLAWCAACEYGHHRRILAEHERARRAAHAAELDAVGSCCRLAELSGGYAHRRCTRPPDVGAVLDVACCDLWVASRGVDHEPDCPSSARRSSAA
ncbi:hypothetical protein AB0J38_25985 [Streptomyces sp. NPDC050095]|uniref:hypothetical protein n=1 Tax=unclassified Streptomyces TaxID=2593676 RepID=UPI00343C7772